MARSLRRNPPAASPLPAPATPTASPQAQPPDAPWRLLPALPLRLQLLILVLAGFLLYASTIPNRYAVDDLIAIAENDYTKKGFGGIVLHLISDSFEGYFGQKKDLLSGGRYRPLSLVSFAIEWGLWGENPHRSHAINALLYGLLGAVLLLMLRQTVLRGRGEVAFLAALLFVLHPIHTEAVANIKGRDELLALLLLLPALVYYVRQARGEGQRNLLWGGLCLFGSLLAKENALMVVALLPLTLAASTPLKLPRLAQATLPALLVVGLYLAMRFALTGAPVGQGSTDVMNNPYIYATGAQALATKILVLGQYLVWLVWPWPLSWDYSYPQVAYVGFDDLRVWLVLLVYGGLVYAALQWWRTVWGWSAGWYLASLFIVSNLVLNIGAFQGERFLFQPSAGFAVALAAGAVALAGWKPVLRWGVGAVLAAVAGLAATAIQVRNSQWFSNETLYLHDVNVSPRSAKANLGAGEASLHLAAFDSTSGFTEAQKQAYFAQALQYFDRALALYPQYNDAFLRKGLTYILMGKNDSAEAMLAQARRLYPDNSKLQKYSEVLANRWYNAAVEERKAFLTALERRELDTARVRVRRAIDLNRRAVAIEPRHHAAWSELGGLYGEAALFDSAYYAFQQATRLQPDHEPYWYGLGISYLRGNRPDLAIAPLERAIRLDGTNPQAKAALEDARRRSQAPRP